MALRTCPSVLLSCSLSFSAITLHVLSINFINVPGKRSMSSGHSDCGESSFFFSSVVLTYASLFPTVIAPQRDSTKFYSGRLRVPRGTAPYPFKQCFWKVPLPYTLRNVTRFKHLAQLFEGRLALNPGLNFTRVSLSCVQSVFLHKFLCYFLSFQSSTCRQKELKRKCSLSFQIWIQISH